MGKKNLHNFLNSSLVNTILHVGDARVARLRPFHVLTHLETERAKSVRTKMRTCAN